MLETAKLELLTKSGQLYSRIKGMSTEQPSKLGSLRDVIHCKLIRPNLIRTQLIQHVYCVRKVQKPESTLSLHAGVPRMLEILISPVLKIQPMVFTQDHGNTSHLHLIFLLSSSLTQHTSRCFQSYSLYVNQLPECCSTDCILWDLRSLQVNPCLPSPLSTACSKTLCTKKLCCREFFAWFDTICHLRHLSHHMNSFANYDLFTDGTPL